MNRGQVDRQAAAAAPVERLALLGLALSLAVLFGGLSHWVIFEYDIFWHVRAGLEILAGQGVQRVDRWSYTVNGERWINIQWLSTVVDAVVYRISGGYEGLSWLRSVLVGSWVFGLAILVGRGASRVRQAWLPMLVLVPWAYLVSSFRLQMRPDLFGICFGAGLLALWLSSWSRPLKRSTSLLILVAWANFHAGTCLFGVLFFVGAVAFGCGAVEPEKLGPPRRLDCRRDGVLVCDSHRLASRWTSHLPPTLQLHLGPQPKSQSTTLPSLPAPTLRGRLDLAPLARLHRRAGGRLGPADTTPGTAA